MASVSVNQRVKGKGNSWRVMWRDTAGDQKQKTFDRKADAEAFAAKIDNDLRSAAYVDPRDRKTPFRVQYDLWIAQRVVSPSRMAADISLATNHVLPRWGDTPIDEIDYAGLQEWVNELRLRARHQRGRDDKGNPIYVTGYAWETVSDCRQIVRHVLTDAIRSKKLHANAADHVRVPNKPRRDITSNDVLTPHEIDRLVGNTPPPWRAFVYCTAWLGWRLSEGCRIRIGDLNLPMRTLTIRGTKTRAATRVLPLPLTVVEVLEKHIASHVPDHRAGALLFPTEDGTEADRSNMRRMLQKALKDAGLDDRGIDWRQLRHTAASLMFAAGVPFMDISYRLGHSRPSTTTDIYTHLMPRTTADSTARLEAFMRGDHL